MDVLACTVVYLLPLTLILSPVRKNPSSYTYLSSSLQPYFVCPRMERKDNGAKLMRFCHRIFNFVMNNLSLYSQRQVTNERRSVSTQTEREEGRPSTSIEHKGVEERDAKSRSVDEEGDIPLIPPVITIPVEAMDMTSAVMTSVEGKQENEKKRRSNRVRSGKREKGTSRDDEGPDVVMNRRPSMGVSTHDSDDDDDKLEDKESTKKVSLGRPPSQQRNEGEASAVRPAKPVARAASNIDKKVDDWIRLKKESFESFSS